MVLLSPVPSPQPRGNSFLGLSAVVPILPYICKQVGELTFTYRLERIGDRETDALQPMGRGTEAQPDLYQAYHCMEDRYRMEGNLSSPLREG